MTEGGSRTFYRMRVAVLLVILLGVILYAWRDIERRRARVHWDRTLDVAIVLVERGSISRTATEAFDKRSADLADQLANEMRRYRPGDMPPFRFRVFGPVSIPDPPPKPDEPGVVNDAEYAWAQWRYVSPIDDRVGLKKGEFDTRIYVVATPPLDDERKLIEGASEQGGRVGIVDVELDDSMVDFALTVVAHELFHTLGASDKYDPATLEVLVPDGLAEPDQVPRYPQLYFELMARHRPLDEHRLKPPKSLSELRVGRATAREIGWLP